MTGVSVFFLSTDTGFVGSYEGKIFKTTNGGMTWIATATPFSRAVVSDIWFDSHTSGWAANLRYLSSNLWHTSDAGLTWQSTAYVGAANGGAAAVRKTSRALVVTQYEAPGISISTDNGASFTTVHLDPSIGLDFSTDLNGVAAGCWANTCYTSDGGLSWHEVPFSSEGWGVYGYRSTRTFLITPENLGATTAPAAFLSTNGGLNWSQASTLPDSLTGDVHGDGSLAYVQARLGGTGLFRTSDRGATWQSIGGPSNGVDRRFAVLDCGQTIYAFDVFGALYRTTNAADGVLHFTCGVDSIRDLKVAYCDSLHRVVRLHNIFPDSISILSVSILDQFGGPLPAQGLTLDSLPNFPAHVSYADSIGFKVAWLPHEYQFAPGIDTVLLRYRYRTPDGSVDSEDIHFRLIADNAAPSFIADHRSFFVDSVRHCDGVDTTLLLSNLNCDTLWVTQAYTNSGVWSVTDSNGRSLALPLGIPSGGWAKVRLHFTPTSTKVVRDSLRITLRFFERDGSYAVPLTGVGMMVDGMASLTSVQFDSVSTCVSNDSLLVLPNETCDTITITQRSFSSNDWMLIDSTGAPLSLPLRLPPGGRTVILRFAPSKLGGTTGRLSLRYTYFGFDSIHTIDLSGAGKQAGALEYARVFDAGSVSLCSILDTVLVFANSSCDPITVDSCLIDSPFVLLDSTILPTQVAAGKTLKLRVRFIPKGKMREQGIVALRYFFNNGIRYDTLRIEAVGLAGASPYAQSPAMDTVAFTERDECGALDSVLVSVTNPGCDTLTVLGTSIEGATSPAIHVTSLAVPVMVAPGDTLRFAIALDTLVPGKYDGTVRVTFREADGRQADTLIYVTATIGKGSRQLLLDTAPIDLGTIRACDANAIQIPLTNTGCLALSLYDWRFRGAASGFLVSHEASAPSLVAANARDTFYIHVPTTRGTHFDTLEIHTNSDSAATRLIAMRVTVLPADSVGFRLVLKQQAVHAGDWTELQVYPDTAIAARGLTRIDGDLKFYTDEYSLGGSATSVYSCTLTPGSVVGRTNTMHFSVTSGSDILLSPITPLFSVPISVYITDTLDKGITLSSVHMSGLGDRFEKCVLSPGRLVDDTLFVSRICGNDLLVRTLQGKPLVMVSHPVPNPLSHSNAYRTTLSLTSAEDGSVTITVYSADGTRIAAGAASLVRNTKRSITLDLQDAAAGNYYYVVTFISSTESGVARGALQLLR